MVKRYLPLGIILCNILLFTYRTLIQVVVLEQPSSLVLLVLTSSLGPICEMCLNFGKWEDVGCYCTEAF